jgi:hypothetical protein
MVRCAGTLLVPSSSRASRVEKNSWRSTMNIVVTVRDRSSRPIRPLVFTLATGIRLSSSSVCGVEYFFLSVWAHTTYLGRESQHSDALAKQVSALA